MKIAICDDNKDDLAVLQEFAKRYYTDAEISSFKSTDEMERALDGDKLFDLYLFDILIDNFTGIDLARLVRKHSENAPIIFITSSTEFALDAFSVEATQYLIKPITYEALSKVFDKLSARLKNAENNFVIVINDEGASVSFDVSDVMYIDYLSRRVNYYLSGEKTIHSLYARTKFAQSIPFSLPEDFIYVQSACIVNLKYVKALSKDSVVLKNDAVLAVSSSKYKEVKTRYFDYFLKNGGGL